MNLNFARFAPFITVLEHLCAVVASLASTKNPAYAGVISLATSGINAELDSIASGNEPTLASAVENVAPGAIALGASLIAANNPTHADAIGKTVAAVVEAIPAPPGS